MVVTLTTCKNEFEAEVIKGNLEANGIKSILQGSNISQVYGGIGGMEVNVLVDQNDYDKAKQVISDTASDAKGGAENEQTEQEESAKEKSLGKKIATYLVLAVMTGVVFALLMLLSVYLFGNPVDWKEITFGSVIFGLIMPYVQAKIDSYYNKK